VTSSSVRAVLIFHKDLVNLFGCRIGALTKIGTFVGNPKRGRSSVTAARSSHTFVCEGVTIEDDVFVGHGVVFINDPRPRATIHGRTQAEIDLTVSITGRVSLATYVGRGGVRKMKELSETGELGVLRFGSHQSRSVPEGLQQVSCTGLAHLQRVPRTLRT
jgi:hypothetical protein